MWDFKELIQPRSAVSYLLARMGLRNSRETALWCVMRVEAGLTMFLYFVSRSFQPIGCCLRIHHSLQYSRGRL